MHKMIGLAWAITQYYVQPETPEQILDRLAKELGCEPRQVCDRVIAMLEEMRKA